MGHTKNNNYGYVQAVISFLIILCTFFPYVEDFIIGSEYKLPAITSFTWFFTQETYTGDKETHIGAFFVAFIMLQILNIFVQTKKNIGLVTIATSLFGIIPIVLLNNFIGDLENEYNFHSINYKYQFGFYFIVVLMGAQILVQLSAFFATLSNQYQGTYTTPSKEPEKPKEQYTATVYAPQPKPQVTQSTSDIELERLKAEAEALRAEQARIKAEEERARLEKERIEKERLKEEYRQLKAQAEQLERERDLKKKDWRKNG